jgi:primase-polymerase (primpol)-like protein
MKRIIEPPMPDWDAIPDAMKQEKRWLLWRSMMVRNKRTGEWKKGRCRARLLQESVPVRKIQYWLSLEEAQKLCKEGGYGGIGFALGDGWAGIDMDSCIIKRGFRLGRNQARHQPKPGVSAGSDHRNIRG